MSREPHASGPGAAPFTERTPRVVAARRLQRRRYRDAERRFLAEGPQAVREALAAGTVISLFVAGDRGAELVAMAEADGVPVSPVTEKAMESLTETVTPQGVVAVCRRRDTGLNAVLTEPPRLLAALVEVRDPGNAGTVLRTADAAGAGAVWFTDQSVDPYNGKCVRASAGSLFHLDVAVGGTALGGVAELRDAGLQVLATEASGDVDLDELADAGMLAKPTAWLFGSEAHGVPAEVSAAADLRVRVPIYGAAESLNLAAAAAVCLYASARAQRKESTS
ncbi:MAG: TrmH family RNA methyltransferase [Micromonosporaceae bacterium]